MVSVPAVTNGWQALVIVTPWVLSFLTAAVGAYFAYQAKTGAAAAKSQAAGAAEKIHELHLLVNSRMEDLLDMTRKLARAQVFVEVAAQQKALVAATTTEVPRDPNAPVEDS